MRIETIIRKQLRLKAHTVTSLEASAACMLVHIDRLGPRLLRCGVCRQRCLDLHDIRKEREWRDLSRRNLPLKLRYRPRRVACPRCGVRVEDFPWAEPWARVTAALFIAVAKLAPELSWQATGASVRVALEQRGDDREAGGPIWAAPSPTSAGTCQRHR